MIFHARFGEVSWCVIRTFSRGCVMTKRSIAFCLGLALFTVSTTAIAQVNMASLTGLVTDPSGAVLAGAKVTAQNKATNAEITTLTNTTGYYTFASLPIGDYRVTLAAPGFRKEVTEVHLDLGQRARFDFKAQVGTATESVTVTSAAPLLSTQDAMPGAVVENRMIALMPLSIRNWDDLLGLIPGVQGDRYTEQGGGTASGRTGAVNVHGVRSLQNNFVLDGVDNNSFSENVQELTTQIVRPSVDAIQEFKISTNPYSAENGRSPGSLVNVTTKSGTNAFHGLAYEYLRNKVFDANDFFTNRARRDRPNHVQNQFGGQVGGPVAKNKAFFFFNYEGTRIRRGRFYQANVPTANERIGDFSAAGYTAMVDRVGDCIGPGTAFTTANTGMPRNNMIPDGRPGSVKNCIDPIAAKILALVPNPNFTGSGALSNVGNFTNVRALQDDTNNYTGRFDWNPNSSNSVWVRYSNSHRFRYIPGTFGGVLDGTSSSANGRLQMNGAGVSVGWNHVFSTRLVNEFHIGWGRNWSRGVQAPFGLNTLADFGFKGVADNPLYSGGIPRIAISSAGGTQSNSTLSIGGVDNWGSPDFLPKFQYTNEYQWLETLNFTVGKHQLKFGVDARVPMRNIFLDVPAMRGQLSFDGNRTGIGLADFLLGYPQAAQLSNLAVSDARLWMLSEFVQDDWKLTPKLALNLGLRYDYATWPYSGADRMSNLLNPNPTAVNAIGALFCPGRNAPPCSAASEVGRSLVKPDKNNFAPRIGLAYQFFPSTVVRAGYGRFYMLFERAGSEDQMFLNPPFLVNNSVTSSSNSTTANGMRLASGFNVSVDPSAICTAAPCPPGVAVLSNIRLRAVNPNNVQPEVDQWNLGIEHQLPWQMVVTGEYVGTKGTHLSILRNLNQIYFDSLGRACTTVAGQPTCPGIAAPFIPYSNLGAIEYRDNVGNSTYHGLELSAQKRFNRGLTFTAAYTWSHSIDQVQEHLISASGSNSFLENEHDLRQQRGDSDFDFRQRFAFGYVYELPFGPGKSMLTSGLLSYVLGGWRLSGAGQFHGGRPFTIFSSSNNSFVQVRGGLTNALADCLGSGNLPAGQQTIDRWFDTTQFARPLAPNPDPSNPALVPRLGTCPRNNMRGPGYSNVDLGLVRVFSYFGESRDLEFRWELFNLLNTPQFGLPTNNVNSGSFGKITSLAGDPRVMQFALRFSF